MQWDRREQMDGVVPAIRQERFKAWKAVFDFEPIRHVGHDLGVEVAHAHARHVGVAPVDRNEFGTEPEADDGYVHVSIYYVT